MNYNQNRKISQITENTLIVGVDIAKHKHVARAQDFRGIDLANRLVFTNDLKGSIIDRTLSGDKLFLILRIA